MQTANESRMVVPALERYAQGPLSELWIGCRGRDDHRWLIPGHQRYGLF